MKISYFSPAGRKKLWGVYLEKIGKWTKEFNSEEDKQIMKKFIVELYIGGPEFIEAHHCKVFSNGQLVFYKSWWGSEIVAAFGEGNYKFFKVQEED